MLRRISHCRGWMLRAAGLPLSVPSLETVRTRPNLANAVAGQIDEN